VFSTDMEPGCWKAVTAQKGWGSRSCGEVARSLARGLGVLGRGVKKKKAVAIKGQAVVKGCWLRAGEMRLLDAA